MKAITKHTDKLVLNPLVLLTVAAGVEEVAHLALGAADIVPEQYRRHVTVGLGIVIGVAGIVRRSVLVAQKANDKRLAKATDSKPDA